MKKTGISDDSTPKDKLESTVEGAGLNPASETGSEGEGKIISNPEEGNPDTPEESSKSEDGDELYPETESEPTVLVRYNTSIRSNGKSVDRGDVLYVKESEVGKLVEKGIVTCL